MTIIMVCYTEDTKGQYILVYDNYYQSSSGLRSGPRIMQERVGLRIHRVIYRNARCLYVRNTNNNTVVLAINTNTSFGNMLIITIPLPGYPRSRCTPSNNIEVMITYYVSGPTEMKPACGCRSFDRDDCTPGPDFEPN
jgi:hypothetical protein